MHNTSSFDLEQTMQNPNSLSKKKYQLVNPSVMFTMSKILNKGICPAFLFKSRT